MSSTLVPAGLDASRRARDSGLVQLAWQAATLSVAFAALGLLATALFRLDGKIDGLGMRVDAKLDRLETNVDAKLDHLGARIDGLAARMDSRFDRVDERLSRVEISLAEHVQLPHG